MTSTETESPAVTRYAAALDSGQAVLDTLRRTAVPPGAWASIHADLHCPTAEAVDAIAAQWLVTPSWTLHGQYQALIKDQDAEACAIYIPAGAARPEITWHEAPGTAA